MSESSDDLSAMAWVHEELRRSLDAAHKALRRFLKEVGGRRPARMSTRSTPAVLRTARSQIHQGVGALELVGLPAAALVLRASEAAVQRAIARPQTLTRPSSSPTSSARRSPCSTTWRACSPASRCRRCRCSRSTARCRKRPRPSASIRPTSGRSTGAGASCPSDPDVVPRAADAAVRAELEAQLLALMRGAQPLAAAASISEICAGLGAGAGASAGARRSGSLAAAMFEAQARRPARLRRLHQARRLAPAGAVAHPRARRVRRLRAAGPRPAVLLRAEPAPGRRGAARRAWPRVRDAYGARPSRRRSTTASACSAASIRRLIAAREEARRRGEGGLVGGGRRRDAPARRPGRAVRARRRFAASACSRSARRSPPSCSTAVGADPGCAGRAAGAAGDGGRDQPALPRGRARGRRLRRSRACGAASRGSPSASPRCARSGRREPLEAWMEELYRRVSDRQTMGSVVQELRASLSEAEKAIDQFFRNPAEHERADPGAAAAVVDARRAVGARHGARVGGAAAHARRGRRPGLDRGRSAREVAKPAVFERLAGNLSALGFLIDMLSVQPQLAKSLFVFDAEAGTLSPVMGARRQRPALRRAAGARAAGRAAAGRAGADARVHARCATTCRCTR